ncbi:MAG: TolB family protein, partial [Thermoanaerobaculia bacterium]
DEGGKQSLWIRQVASSSDIRIVPLADVHFVGGAFSPDANFLYYCSADNRTDQGAVYQVPVIGGVPKQIVDDLHVRMMVSPDGKRFAYAKTDRAAGRSIVATRQMDGTGERVVAERKLPDTFTAVTWSPDGESLGYSFVTYGGGYHAVIGDVKIEGGKERVISGPTWRIVDSLIWLPDDQLVVNAKDKSDSRNQLWMLRRDGRARRITNDLSDYEQASVTSDGTKLVTLQKNQTSSVWIAPGGVAQHARQLARGADNLDGMYGLTCLRDGHIVYTSSSNDARDLWIMDRDGGSRRRLSDGGSDTLPAASPDGKLIVFMSMRTGRSNIWRLDVATGATAPITSGDFESSPSLSPDGTWVAFHTNRSGVRTVWRTGVIGGGPVKQVTTTASSWPSVSPDGKQIACSWFDPTNGRIGIAVVPSDGGAPSHIFDIPVNAWMGGNNHHVRWHESGLTYVSNLNGVSNIWLQPLDGGDARQLTRFEDGQIFYFDWTADGRDLVASRGEVTSNVVLIEGFR